MNAQHLCRSVFVFVLIAVFASSAAVAQTRHHDLSASYGIVTLDQITDILTDVLTIVLTFGTFGKTNTEYTGAPFLTYHYSAGGRFGVGLAAGWYRSKGDLVAGGATSGTFLENNFIGALEIDYHWLMKKGIQLYSGAGVGARVRRGTYNLETTEVKTQVLPTLHLNVLGIRVGGPVGFFAELGAGYKGIVNVGLNAQF